MWFAHVVWCDGRNDVSWRQRHQAFATRITSMET